MLDDLNELRTLQRILATGSLSAAAREMGVGLGVVSKRLRSLERRTGIRLVNRTTRRLSPTEEGLALAAHVDRALNELASAEVQLGSAKDAPSGVLRVSAPVSLGRIHVAPVLAELASQYRGLAAELMLDDKLVDLVAQRIDLAVRIGAPRDSSAVMRKLADNHRVLAASPGYLDRAGRPQHPRDAEDHEFLRYGDESAPWRLEGTGDAVWNLRARCRLRADNGDVVRDWAIEGRGILLKSLVDLAPDLASGRLEQVLPRWRSAAAPVYALLPPTTRTPLKTRVLLDALVTRFAIWRSPRSRP